MDTNKRKAVIFIIIGFLILALILFYFPFILSRPALKKQRQIEQSQTQENKIQSPVLESETSASIDSFSGLEDENKSLEELENLLEGY